MAATAAAPILSLRNLKTRFYTYEGVVRALEGVDFDIHRGETFGLVGETGCGKSVTALSMMRLVPSPPGKIEEGEVLFLVPPDKWAQITALESEAVSAFGALREALRGASSLSDADASLLKALEAILSSDPPRLEARNLMKISDVLRGKGLAAEHKAAALRTARELIQLKSPYDLLTRPDDYMRKVRGNLMAMIFQEPMSALNPVIIVGDQIAENILLHQKENLAREVLRDLDRDLTLEAQSWQRAEHDAKTDTPRCSSCRAELPEKRDLRQEGGEFVSRWRRGARPGSTMLRLAVLLYALSIPIEFALAKALVESTLGREVTWGVFLDVLFQSSLSWLVITGMSMQALFVIVAGMGAFWGSDERDLSLPMVYGGSVAIALSLVFFGGLVGAIGGFLTVAGGLAARNWQKEKLGVDACPGCHRRFSGPPWRPVLRVVPIRMTRYLYQRMARDPNDFVLTVASRVPFLRRYERVMYGIAFERAVEMLRQVRIPDPEKVATSYPFELSGGMAQRAMIAIALSCSPRLLIADEPTTAVDVTIQAQVLKLMRDLKERVDASILLITHNLGVVAETCNRVGVMYAGIMAEIGPTRGVFKEPLHPYTRGLMESIPRTTEEKDRLLVLHGNVPNLITPPPGCRFHPRCPVALPHCGWSAAEVRERLEPWIQKERDAGVAPAARIRGWNDSDPERLLVRCDGDVNAVRGLVERLLAAHRAEDIALGAVEMVTTAGNAVVLTLLPQVKPPMLEANPGHSVACYQYGGWPPA